ncbi:hypothetical protein chiPu_0030494 [Chiloscyllium punctatum]|uniref:Uncharacterized protein n=1 Tax=Chiloscyllium punctatum TaxID=137246 RepID=A0A401TUX9_CHIPU|nr:hypothetical protein [Chiloscyllium punctatum]
MDLLRPPFPGSSIGSSRPAVSQDRHRGRPPLPDRPISAALLEWMKNRPLPRPPREPGVGSGTARGPERPANPRLRQGELTAMDIILGQSRASARPNALVRDS